MKYTFILLIFLISSCSAAIAQPGINTDSLRNVLVVSTDDSIRYRAYASLSEYYFGKKNDSAFLFTEKRLETARRGNKQISVASSLDLKASIFMQLERYVESYTAYLEALEIADKVSAKESSWDPTGPLSPENYLISLRATIHNDLAMMLGFAKNQQEQLIHFHEAEKLFTRAGMNWPINFIYVMYSRIFLQQGNLDSSLHFARIAEQEFQKTNNNHLLALATCTLGTIYDRKNDLAKAQAYYYRARDLAGSTGNTRTLVAALYGLSSLYYKLHRNDSMLLYAKETYDQIKPLGVLALFDLNTGKALDVLGKAYALNGNKDSAIICQSLALRIQDSLFNIERTSLAEFRHLNVKENLRIQELEQEKDKYRAKTNMAILIGGLLLLLVVAAFIFYNYLQQKKAKRNIELAFKELKDTQAQLLHSEKMASLGELTAGIAHEIQNPLNFVNNFSEVNKELTEELESELKSGNSGPAIDIARDIRENSEKINHHGKRAESIVKGMLQHSRTSSGQKEPTDINALCDEYLRLAYHGLRAKDKSFNARYETHFDPALPQLNVVSQDIGRVILNLVNNAFYAVNEKNSKSTEPYDPLVAITTRKLPGKIEIIVEDNGPGIPDKVKDKIFQPFFTTKPTGQGTGLGLSLSYDIVKSHGGELRVETKDGQGSRFFITLPG